MSVSGFEEIYAACPPTGDLRARPLGTLAASMIGAAAVLVLGGVLFFIKPRLPETAEASAPPRAPAATVAQPAEPPSAPSAAAPAKLSAAFDLTASEFNKEKKSFSVRLRDQGGRDDIMTIGEFSGASPFLRLAVLQAGGEKFGNSDFYLDMSRHASQAGLAVVHIGRPTPLTSRFGAFEAADIRLTPNAAETSGGSSGAAGERGCLAVRLMNSKLSLEIVGLACSAGSKPVDRRAMSCLLNRLDYSAPGENKALDQFFVKTEVDDRSQSCSGSIASASAAKPAARLNPQSSKRSTQAR
jgi:hypothetical protein